MSRVLDISPKMSRTARLAAVTVADLRAETRAFGRARLRELALDAAREVVLDRGWSAVRMGSIATAVGISRQSLHAEFGTKDDLGDALVMREVSIFFEGMLERLDHHPGDLAGAVRDAAAYIFDAASDNPLLQTILTRAPAQGDFSLLPLLTTRGEPLIGRAAGLFGDWVNAQWPETDADDTRLMVESVVRLALSHILTPTLSASQVADHLALLACRCLRWPDPPAQG
jgi:AcrR family transcriptional regulator